MKTKDLRFTYNGIEFFARVTFSSEKFSSSEKSFYSTELIKPISLQCGGYTQINKGWNMASREFRESHFVYEENESKELKSSEINIYPKAVRDIKYYYFNRKELEKVEKKITAYNSALDKRYLPMFSELQYQKRTLKEKLKTGILDKKRYQQEVTKINSDRIGLEMLISNRKKRYYNRYFECCRLKNRFRN